MMTRPLSRNDPMTITIATRADVRSEQLDRFLTISADIVGSMLTVPGNLGVRITNADLAWFTLTAWADRAALEAFVVGRPSSSCHGGGRPAHPRNRVRHDRLRGSVRPDQLG